MAMTLDEALARLQALGDEKRRAINVKNGAGDNQYGVPMGEIRKLAAAIKGDHALGLALWGTGNIDAQLLGILLIKPKTLSAAELDGMVRSGRFGQVADWLASYVIKHHPAKETLRAAWLQDPDPWAGRAGGGANACGDRTASIIRRRPLHRRHELEVVAIGVGQGSEGARSLISGKKRDVLSQRSQRTAWGPEGLLHTPTTMPPALMAVARQKSSPSGPPSVGSWRMTPLSQKKARRGPTGG
jgi:hypothetical protein